MTIDGERFPFFFRTWSRVGRNYVVIAGYDPVEHTWGLDLCWGRRDLLGETVKPGELRFADRLRWSVQMEWG